MDWVEFVFLGIGTYFDIKDRELPVKFFIFFGIMGIGMNLVGRYQSFQEVLIGGCMGGVFLAVGWITKEAIGYGDGWGLVILGILKGWQELIPIVFGAFLLGGIYGLWKLIVVRASRYETMPFYPFLLAASVGVSLL